MLALQVFLPLLTFISIALCGRFISKGGTIIISTFAGFVLVMLSVTMLYEVANYSAYGNITLAHFLNASGLDVSLKLRVDTITAIMFFVVSFISFIVNLYSIEYMGGDPHYIRFVSYLLLFIFFMLVFLASDNLFIFFFGWEGVGLCSYLLVSFWYTRTQANSSAIKAFIVNRVGDLFLIIGFTGIILLFGSANYSVIFSSVYIMFNSDVDIFFGKFACDSINFISLMFSFGVFSKSAQIFLHSWLPDAMEGPTPVSALIHAATMVAAGVFLLLRFSYFFSNAAISSDYVALIGLITTFFAASIGFFQNDVKKIIAFSTCSQLGYMVFSSGAYLYFLSIFHLVNHAFFKALLFLSSGSLIHSFADNQDIRRMGGALLFLPFTYLMFFIGSAALVGLPFITGFYSKDIIIENSILLFSPFRTIIFSISIFSAFLTSAYSFRLIFLVFITDCNFPNFIQRHLHENKKLIFISLLVLSIFSIFFGFLAVDFFVFDGGWFFEQSIFQFFTFGTIDFEFSDFFTKNLAFLLTFLGFYLSIFFSSSFFSTKNKRKKLSILDLVFFKTLNKLLFIFFSKKWLFDSLANFYVSFKIFNLSYSSFLKSFDRGFLEFFGPVAIMSTINNLTGLIKLTQTGFFYHYIVYFFFLTFTFLFLFFSIFVSTSFINIFYVLFAIFAIFYSFYYNFFIKNKKTLIDVIIENQIIISANIFFTVYLPPLYTTMVVVPYMWFFLYRYPTSPYLQYFANMKDYVFE